MTRQERYSTVIGVRTHTLTKLFDYLSAAPDDDEVIHVANVYRTHSSTVRSANRIARSARVTVTEHPGMLTSSRGTTHLAYPDDIRLVIVNATGAVSKQWRTLPEALGLTPEEILAFQDIDHPIPADLVDIHSGAQPSSAPYMTGLVALTRWRMLPIRPPAFVAHTTIPEDVTVLHTLITRAAPTFLRNFVPTFILPTDTRTMGNQIIGFMGEASAAMNGEEPAAGPIAFRSVCVLGDHDTGLGHEITAGGRTPLDSKDPRKLAKSLQELMESVPDPMQLLPLLPPAAQEPAPPTEPANTRELDDLTAELRHTREVVKAREATIVELRRELRALHYAHTQAAAHPEVTPEPEAPADEPEDRAPTPVSDEPPLRARHQPVTFAEVFDLTRTHLSRVVLPERVTSQVAELTGTAKTSVWVARTWAILTSLQEYAEQRTDGLTAAANLRTWMTTQTHPAFSPSQVAIGESAVTASTKKFRTERTFRVPRDVNPSGRVVMESHVRVDAGGSYPAPRLYFYDDTTGTTGQIHVGYIGPHLRNKLTT